MHREMMIATRILFTASLRRQYFREGHRLGIIPSERSRNWQRIDSNSARFNRNIVDDSFDSVARDTGATLPLRGL